MGRIQWVRRYVRGVVLAETLQACRPPYHKHRRGCMCVYVPCLNAIPRTADAAHTLHTVIMEGRGVHEDSQTHHKIDIVDILC